MKGEFHSETSSMLEWDSAVLQLLEGGSLITGIWCYLELTLQLHEIYIY